MDTEQQIRLNFLDEAEEYFDLMESNLVGLANAEVDPAKIDNVLRSAHSIKGGAGMMSFTNLSQVAHRLEDFLKILRVRYASSMIDIAVETLLLQSVDSLRHLGSLNRLAVAGGDPQTEAQMVVTIDRLQPVFEELRSLLGDLEVADENALLAQDEDSDPALLIFEEGVEEILTRFEEELSNLDLTELAEKLSVTAQELIGFGNMASLDPFIQLCESIQHQAASVSEPEITALANQALKTWKKSHALVLLGSVEKIPSYLEGYETVNQASFIEEFEEEVEPFDLDALELSGLQSAFELEVPEDSSKPELFGENSVELSKLQSAFELEVPEDSSKPELFGENSVELSKLQSVFELDSPEVESTAESTPEALNTELNTGLTNLSGLTPTVELTNIKQTVTEIQLQAQNQAQKSSAFSSLKTPSNPTPSVEQVDKMVRVPASQLKQFNNLFEQLVLNRNSITLRLEQLQGVIALMSQRMSQMERSNTQLKQWYDRASVEGLLSDKEQLVASGGTLTSNKHPGFDSLEMDRYSDIHLICQEQIETIVQLQEVATDIELGLQQVHQSARDLHYTTRSMQGNVTRTQMLPFADAVKRFPRVIRDLNLQFAKKVELKIIGERTLLDRLVIETLSDPLMHLLRNSFDHGIETPQARIAAGKPEAGTITIQANNQGTYSVITISDDGGGIPLEKIRDRVHQMGFSQAEVSRISEAELLNFIFEPGFSTASQVTELSGRGVGMDVVRTNLQEIRGDIRVDTKLGQGTTFKLRIPFTLSILRVAIVEQGGIVFAIPANSIRELISGEPQEELTPEDTKIVPWQQTKIPLIEIEKILVYNRLYNAVGLTGTPTINQTMTLVVGDDQFFAALKISRFWDEQESTIRAIDSPVPLPPGVISSVVFGDGKVIPLIDPLALAERYASDRLNPNSADVDLGAANDLPVTKTILIVDDSINVRRYLSLTLEKAGYRVEQAKDGLEALDKLTSGLVVQGVISDVEMPRLDGYGFLIAVKEKPELANLPVAMLTSRNNDKHRKLAMDLGASAYFSKPYNEQELLQQLAEILV
ncbi:MAG: hybrid sensor histidine kinase/response regulator [Pleurocapsa minor HA4230-MV1]|jgi:chemosensory pili system protein ChpA (sensor histidine kinase/response regulator)|nr:hybrid sensor histidine kinase/response regulator [Pleurocapsa minor HA4230-MV1]